MKTRTKIMLLAGILACVLGNGNALAAAHDSNEGWRMKPQPGGPDGIIGIIQHRLDLTSDQQSQIKTILDADSNAIDAARQAVANAHRALEDAVFADANEAAIRSAATTLGNAIGDEAVLRAARLKEVKAVLTTDQINKLEGILAKMKTGGGRPPRGGPMPGAMSPPYGE